MKILQVITSLGTGGAETLVFNLIPRLIKLGHQVDLCLFNAKPAPLLEKLKKSDLHINIYEFGRSYYNPLYIFKLAKIIKDYDIVHTHTSSPQLYAAIANLLHHKKLVTTEHSTYNRKRDHFFLKCSDRWMYHQYDSIICISQIAENILKDYLNASEDFSKRIQTINNGVDVELFHHANSADRKALGSEEKRFVVAMVAGFREGKDQDTAIKAIAQLPKEKFELWLVGDGVRRAEIEKCIQQEHAGDQVKLLGVRMDVPHILKAADVIVMSSHWEGLSLSNIEGMSAGKPFVASNVNGLREVTDGYGILFEDSNSKELAAIIQRLAEDKPYYQHVADQCYLRAKQFDISITTQQYNDIYMSL